MIDGRTYEASFHQIVPCDDVVIPNKPKEGVDGWPYLRIPDIARDVGFR